MPLINLHKKILSITLLVFCVGLLAPFLTQAQDFVEIEDAPRLYITDIVVPASAQTGEFISGSFVLHNAGNATAEDIEVAVSLLEYTTFEDGSYGPLARIDVQKLERQFDVPFGKMQVPYTYTVPESVANAEGYGIEIAVYQNEYLLMYEYAQMDLTGNLRDDITYGASLVIGEDEEFALLEGPTLLAGEVPVVRFDFTDSERKPATVIAQATVYEGLTRESEKVTELNDITFSLQDDTALIQNISLPNNLPPAVYTAVISFHDENGELVATPAEVRYIIDGIKPKIGEIYVLEDDQRDVERLEIAVSYVDTPVSSRRDSNGQYIDPRAETYFVQSGEDVEATDTGYIPADQMTARIAVYDVVSNEVVREQDIEFAGSFNQVAVFDPIKDVNEVRIVVDLFQNGNQIDSRSITTSLVPPEKSGIFALMENPEFKLAMIVMGIVLLLIITIIGYMIGLARKKKMNDVLVGNSVNTEM